MRSNRRRLRELKRKIPTSPFREATRELRDQPTKERHFSRFLLLSGAIACLPGAGSYPLERNGAPKRVTVLRRLRLGWEARVLGQGV